MKHRVTKHYGLKIAACYLWGAPWVIVGFLFGATVIGIPVALVLFAIGSFPLGKLQERHLRRKLAWQKEQNGSMSGSNASSATRSEALPTQGIPPWLLEAETEMGVAHRMEPDSE